MADGAQRADQSSPKSSPRLASNRRRKARSTFVRVTDGVLHPPEEPGTRERDLDAIDLDLLGHAARFLVLDAACAPHQIDHDFVGHADDHVLLEVVARNAAHRLIRQGHERRPDTGRVLRAPVDQQVDVVGGAAESGLDDRHSADDHVPSPLAVEVATEGAEVF